MKQNNDVTISNNRHNYLLEAERLMKSKKMILVIDLGWGRRQVVKTNDEATRMIALELQNITAENRRIKRVINLFCRNRAFNFLGRLCFRSKWQKLIKL